MKDSLKTQQYASICFPKPDRIIYKDTQKSAYLHKCGCSMLIEILDCIGNNRTQECSHIYGDNMEGGCIHRCLNYHKSKTVKNVSTD